jgi:hypothetical protein
MAKSITYVGLDVRRYILGHIGPHNIAIHEQPSHLQRLRYRRRRDSLARTKCRNGSRSLLVAAPNATIATAMMGDFFTASHAPW